MQARGFLISALLLGLFLSVSGAKKAYDGDSAPYIVVDKPNFILSLISRGDTIFSAPVCLGENRGQKRIEGDHKTPEGAFSIWTMENSSRWGKRPPGASSGAYGPWFFRLKIPGEIHIGIHGTDEPESVGHRRSEGCVRLRNEDLLRLKSLIRIGMPVIITQEGAEQPTPEVVKQNLSEGLDPIGD